jgi:hypothetical protein
MTSHLKGYGWERYKRVGDKMEVLDKRIIGKKEILFVSDSTGRHFNIGERKYGDKNQEIFYAFPVMITLNGVDKENKMREIYYSIKSIDEINKDIIKEMLI